MDEKDEIVLSIDIIDAAITFSESRCFQNRLDEFESKHESMFELTEGQDIPIEAACIFEEFQDLLESMFHDFCKEQDCDFISLFENCRDTIEGRYLPLFVEQHKNHWWVELVLSWASFDNFLKRMFTRVRNRHK